MSSGVVSLYEQSLAKRGFFSDAARRFTWLVDVSYDDRVNLVVSAEGEQSAEFQRTVSRLHEMQSVQYLQSERRRASGEVQGLQADGSR